MKDLHTEKTYTGSNCRVGAVYTYAEKMLDIRGYSTEIGRNLQGNIDEMHKPSRNISPLVENQTKSQLE